MNTRRIPAGTAMLTLLALLCCPFAHAQTWGAATGNANGTTNTVAVIPAGNGGTPIVEYLSATSDVAGSVVQFYAAGPAVLVNGTSAADGTNVITAGGTNAFAPADRILLRAVGSDLYQLTTVGTVGPTNITTLNALSRALAPGDAIYKLSTSGRIPVGAATVSIAGPLWVGDRGRPVAMVLTATNSASINSVTFTLR
jgi:hypothetical protein